MKTMSSKMRKAGMETMAVIAVLVATCLTISAQGAKFETNEFKGTTLALAETSIKMTSAKAETEAEATLAAFSAYLVEEKEVELETEEWMLNVDNFFMEYNLETVTEEALKVEEWMLDVNNFYCDFRIEEETEEPLKTESWMENYSYWDRK